jgi:hypothetical protein
MARRMDRKVIKLEAALGSERQFIVVTRKQDLIVRDVMEEVQKVFKIPIEVQTLFHKGTNLCDFMDHTLESLGVENNHPIRVCRDDDLLNKSPRARQSIVNNNSNNNQSNRRLSPVSYLKEISPGRVPDPTPHQVQMYK